MKQAGGAEQQIPAPAGIDSPSCRLVFGGQQPRALSLARLPSFRSAFSRVVGLVNPRAPRQCVALSWVGFNRSETKKARMRNRSVDFEACNAGSRATLGAPCKRKWSVQRNASAQAGVTSRRGLCSGVQPRNNAL